MEPHGKQSPPTNSPLTSNPLIPTLLLLLVAFALLYSSPVRTWLTTADDLPTLAQIFSFSREEKRNVLPKAGENVRVWAKKKSGFYYCRGGALFGNKPGKMMAQVDALMSGYRPSDGDYCSSGQQMVASSAKPSLENQQRHNQADVSPQQGGALVQISTRAPDISQAEGRIRVWAIKKFGSYYCRDEILFGDKPGKLMSQSDALMAGYRPSEGRCNNDKPKETVAGNLLFGSQLPPAAATTSPQKVESLASMKKAPKISKAEGGVKVWVKTELGFYYCHNDVLFGNKPGQQMAQADALTAGYRPSDGRCSNDKPTRSAAESVPSGVFPDTK
jgi:guanyl-specific ribonuclease Sa